MTDTVCFLCGQDAQIDNRHVARRFVVDCSGTCGHYVLTYEAESQLGRQPRLKSDLAMRVAEKMDGHVWVISGPTPMEMGRGKVHANLLPVLIRRHEKHL